MSARRNHKFQHAPTVFEMSTIDSQFAILNSLVSRAAGMLAFVREWSEAARFYDALDESRLTV